MKTTKDLITECLELQSTIDLRLLTEGKQLVEKLCESHSLRSIAKAIGCSPTYLSLVKNGRVVISQESYLKLVDFGDGLEHCPHCDYVPLGEGDCRWCQEVRKDQQ